MFRNDSDFGCLVDALEFPGNNSILKVKSPYVMELSEKNRDFMLLLLGSRRTLETWFSSVC